MSIRSGGSPRGGSAGDGDGGNEGLGGAPGNLRGGYDGNGGAGGTADAGSNGGGTSPGGPHLPRMPRLPGGGLAAIGGLGAIAIIWPILAALGLALVGAVSLSILNGQLPTVGGNGGQQGPIKTPTPSNVVNVDKRAQVLGTIVYVKDGNLWIQTGGDAKQLTTGGNDAMPTWSTDGQWIYFIRTTSTTGRWPANGVIRTYDLDIPAVVRMHPDGTGLQTIYSGKVTRNGNTWQSFIRQPFPNPADTKVAVITDAPTPDNSDVVLKILDLASGTLVDPGLTEVPPLGHQDPAWSPDGGSILYVKNARAGTRGTPLIMRYDLTTRHSKALTGPGYLSPAWSPDGRFVAATKTGSFGTDIVILDARTGAELLRLTSDELSFGPVWSPAEDSIAFFRVDHGVVDLELAKLQGSPGAWSVGEVIPMTQAAGLDAASRPSWFIPANQLPTAPPSTPPSLAPFPTLHGPSSGPTPGPS
jgi:dipeptidyl aminopeptidase/acylaminoacyl peptidase